MLTQMVNHFTFEAYKSNDKITQNFTVHTYPIAIISPVEYLHKMKKFAKPLLHVHKQPRLSVKSKKVGRKSHDIVS